MFYVKQPFFAENLTVYEIMWEKNGTVGQATDRQYDARALYTGYLRLKHTLRICNTYCFSTSTMVARTRRNITLYVHCLSSLHFDF